MCRILPLRVWEGKSMLTKSGRKGHLTLPQCGGAVALQVPRDAKGDQPLSFQCSVESVVQSGPVASLPAGPASKHKRGRLNYLAKVNKRVLSNDRREVLGCFTLCAGRRFRGSRSQRLMPLIDDLAPHPCYPGHHRCETDTQSDVKFSPTRRR